MSMGGLPQQKWLQAALYAGLLLLFAVAVVVGMTTPMPEDELALEQARIYIGNYQFVHASSAKSGVIVSDLSSGYYNRYFVGGRHI